MSTPRGVVAVVLCASAFGECADAAPVFSPLTSSWYEVVLLENRWTEARAAAEASTYLGIPGRLVTVTTSAENAFVFGILPVEQYGFWLGGFQLGDDEPSGGWEWISGEEWSFTNWDNAEPNNLGTDEDFLQMYSDWTGEPLPERRLPGTWNDLSDDRSYHSAGYVIEYAVPEPSIAVLAGMGAFAAMLRRTRR